MTMGTIRIIPTTIAISGGGSTYGMDGDGVAFMFAIRATPRLADKTCMACKITALSVALEL